MILGMQSLPAHWIQPDWPIHPRVRSLMTTRRGGVSAAPWDSLNLGDHVGDRVADVHSNRERLTAHIGQRPVFLQQVHGVASVQLGADTPNGLAADACWSLEPGVACTIMVADCLPVLLCDASGQWVAAAHAGWRGLAGVNGQGVLESLLSELPVHGHHGELMAWLGPCIGPNAFEVGQEVRSAFQEGSTKNDAFFLPLPNGKYLADLAGLARQRLHQLGVGQIFGNDGHPSWCTFTNSDQFFSHRRDSRVLGQSGRMAACIWLDR